MELKLGKEGSEGIKGLGNNEGSEDQWIEIKNLKDVHSASVNDLHLGIHP